MAETPTEFALEWTADREDAAAVFRSIAAALEAGDSVRLRGTDASATVTLPPRVDVELEVEREPDDPATAELEVELAWEDADDETVQFEGDGTETDAEVDAADEPETDEREGAVPVVGPTADPTASGSDADSADGRATVDRAGRTSRFEVYEDRAGQWRWRLVHWNGNVVADSGEGYASRANARRAVRGVRRAVPSATVEDAAD